MNRADYACMYDTVWSAATRRRLQGRDMSRPRKAQSCLRTPKKTVHARVNRYHGKGNGNQSRLCVSLLVFALLLLWSPRPVRAEEVAAECAGPATAQPAVTPLSPIVVSATRTEMSLEDVPANVTVLTRDDIKQSPTWSVDDLLRQIPGFSTFRRSSSLVTAPAQDPEAQGVTLRGIGPGGASRALVLEDGIPVNDAFGGWIYWGALPLEDIEQIEVVRGGNSNLWGNFALGGVINIVPRSPQGRVIEPELSFGNRDTVDANLLYGDQLGPLRYTLQGNFFRTDGWNIIARKQRGPIDQNSDSEHKSFNGRVEYDLNEKFSVFLRGSFYNESRNTGTPFRTSDTDRGFMAAGGRLEAADGSLWQLNSFFHLTTFQERFSKIGGEKEEEGEGGDGDAPPAEEPQAGDEEERRTETPSQIQRVPSRDVGGSLTWSRHFFSDHLLSAGTDYRLIRGKSRDFFFDADGRDIELQRVSRGQQTFVGFFLQEMYTPIPRLQITLGARLDYFRNFDGRLTETPDDAAVKRTRFRNQDRVPISPKLAFRYQVIEGLALRGAGYQAFRAPTLSELYRRSSVEGLVLLENPGLGPEYLEGGELGFDYTGFPRLTVRATAYWNNLRRAISNITTAHDPATGEDSERKRVNLGLARIRGIEAEAEYRLTAQLSITGSYLYSEARVLDARDPDLEGKRLAQVPWNTATVGIRYTNPSLVNFLIQLRAVDKQFEDADNRDKLGGYYVIDLALSKALPRVSFLPFLHGGEMFVGIQNLLDRDYEVDRGGGILKIGTPLLFQGGVRLRF